VLIFEYNVEGYIFRLPRRFNFKLGVEYQLAAALQLLLSFAGLAIYGKISGLDPLLEPAAGADTSAVRLMGSRAGAMPACESLVVLLLGASFINGDHDPC
jgi:hypothetical protein